MCAGFCIVVIISPVEVTRGEILTRNPKRIQPLTELLYLKCSRVGISGQDSFHDHSPWLEHKMPVIWHYNHGEDRLNKNSIGPEPFAWSSLSLIHTWVRVQPFFCTGSQNHVII